MGRVMERVSKRLEVLLRMTGVGGPGKAEPFAWYGLAMEYRSLERFDEALATFERLRVLNPEYLPMYLMCGQMLGAMGRLTDAHSWLATGVDAARRQGDGHALSELEGALAALG
jgi:tetratricopeptide (TPR) repeat protein